MALDTLGHLLAVHVTPADEQERAQVQRLCEDVQQATGHPVQSAWKDLGYTDEVASKAAQDSGFDLQAMKLPDAKKGLAGLPRRWVVDRSFGWLARFRRLSCDHELSPGVLGRLHFLVSSVLSLPAAARVLAAAGKFITRSRELLDAKRCSKSGVRFADTTEATRPTVMNARLRMQEGGRRCRSLRPLPLTLERSDDNP